MRRLPSAAMAQTLPTAVATPRRRPGGPRRWTAADKAAYLAAFATSPLSIKAFCAETGVPRATFTLWQGEARAAARAHRDAPPRRRRRKAPAFARVKLVPPPATTTGGIGGMVLVMRGPAGVEAELSGLDAATLVTVLHAVFGAGARPAR
jgi:transposase-like protein